MCFMIMNLGSQSKTLYIIQSLDKFEVKIDLSGVFNKNGPNLSRFQKNLSLTFFCRHT